MSWRVKVVADLAKKFVSEIADQLKRLAKNSKKAAKEYYRELKNLHEVKKTGDREEFREALKDFLLKIKYDLTTLSWPNMYLQLLKYWLNYVDDAYIEDIVDQLGEYGIVKREDSDLLPVDYGLWDNMKSFVERMGEKFRAFKRWIVHKFNENAYILKPWTIVVTDLAKLFIKEASSAVAKEALIQGVQALQDYKYIIGEDTFQHAKDAVIEIVGETAVARLANVSK